MEHENMTLEEQFRDTSTQSDHQKASVVLTLSDFAPLQGHWPAQKEMDDG